MWPSRRIQAEEEGATVPGEAVMEGVEHFGQYVYEMSVTKIKQAGLPEPIPEDSEVQYIPESDEDEEVEEPARRGERES